MATYRHGDSSGRDLFYHFQPRSTENAAVCGVLPGKAYEVNGPIHRCCYPDQFARHVKDQGRACCVTCVAAFMSYLYERPELAEQYEIEVPLE